MSRIATILFALSILASSSAYAQYFQLTNFKEGSGLPSSESYMVFQDSRGFIWIGTDNGVVKYDGHEFVTYNMTSGLTDNTVFGFYEDWKGRVWFRTYNGALSYYENDTIKSYKYNKELKSFVNSAILSNIYYDSLDNLYFSTTLYPSAARIDSKGSISFLSQVKDDLNFIRLEGDKILIGTSGLPQNLTSIRIDDQLFHIDLDDPRRQTNLAVACVRWKGKLYFSVYKNIFAYDGSTVKRLFSAESSFISLNVDGKDRLWAGYFNNGVQVFEDELLTKSFSLSRLSKMSVSSVLQDYEGGMWISTLDQGVFYFPNLNVQNYSPPNDTRISAVASSNGEVFLGNYDGDVFKMDAKGAMQTINKGIAPVSQLFFDKANNLWISDEAGTYIHKPNAYKRGRRISLGSFNTLSQAGDEVIACSSMVVFRLSAAGDILKKMEARKRPSTVIAVDNDIYLGGINGLEKFNLDFSGQALRIMESRTSSLVNIENKFVVAGTIGQGLMIYDVGKGLLSALPIADVTSVYSIVSDWPQQRLWIGTDKGLFQLNFQKGVGELVLDHFSKADGLLSSKINKVCRIDNNICAVSDLGISSVPLAHFGESMVPPKFYISRILFQNYSLAANTSIVKTTEADMIIDIRAITFKAQPMLFRYRLNKDQSWNLVPGGSIFLVDLRPGKYAIDVQASTGNSNWTDSATLQIEVMINWWETRAFLVGSIAALILLACASYVLRIKAIRRKHKHLELITIHQQKLIDSEMWAQERERKRIAADLHDGIGASLSSIKIQISDVASNGAGAETRFKEIDDNLTDVIDDVKRIVYDLHPPGLERYGLHAGLKSLVDRTNKTSDINVIFDYYGQRNVAQSISITIFRIVQELINNTLKHAQASEVRIHINEFDNEINIMYEDNGIGMNDSRFTGLGLHSIESRVRSLNGRMSWESNDKGTFYNFDIPF